MVTHENKSKKARQMRAKGLHSPHCSTKPTFHGSPRAPVDALGIAPQSATELSACLANPSPMLLSGFLMPAI
jgi:hypothetical protein